MFTRRRWNGVVILTCFVFLTSASLRTADPQELRDPCVANMMGSLGELGGGTDQPYTKGTIFERVPPSVIDLAQRPHPPTVTTVLAIPFDENEFRSVFKVKEKEEISQSDSRELKSAKLAYSPMVSDLSYYEKLGELGPLKFNRRIIIMIFKNILQRPTSSLSSLRDIMMVANLPLSTANKSLCHC
jgi:hypothetical protein